MHYSSCIALFVAQYPVHNQKTVPRSFIKTRVKNKPWNF